MTRVHTNPRTLLIDVNEIYNLIEKDLVDNASHILWEYDYYTKKYRGDRLNNVNVGIHQNQALEFVAQIYVDNGIDIRKSHLILSRDYKRISRVDELINTIKATPMQIKLKVYDEKPYEQRLRSILDSLIGNTTFSDFKIIKQEVEGEYLTLTLEGVE